ncbi:outer membrane homotrimeric porin [Nitratidesulfovibrio sp. 1201_IL3209]|uniref:outer membrane homotrimeric porin n=1 Tax=Nitratidesulfovibrio sp. 1201_IL3209 TaxID=3084053 RepID=UPI002FDA289A
MKRFATLMLAFALVLGAFSGAQAADIKAKGVWAFDFSWLDSGDYKSSDDGGDGEDDFSAAQRFRTQIDVIASESLKGVVFFEIGHQVWGREDGALGADGKAVKVRRSYIDWLVPNTELKVRMGIQGLSLPGAVAPSSPIFDDDVAALTLSYAVNDMVGVTALWARPVDSSSGNTVAENRNDFDEVDVFALAVPVTLDGFKITPYGVYASVGKDAGFANVTNEGWEFTQGMLSMAEAMGSGIDQDSDTYNAWWGGVAFEMSYFAPFGLKVDAVYGSKTADDDAESAERAGWLVAALAEYKLDMVTPGILAWYGSGEDDDMSDGSERMPSISPTGWGVTSFGFPGSVYRQDTYFGLNGAGTWAVGLQLADISFMENLSHVFRVVYMQGTNDADVIKDTAGAAAFFSPKRGEVFLTDDDSAIEVNFDTTYKIYENLSLVVEMGWIKLDMDEDTWGTDDFSDAKKLVFNFIYEF